MKKRFLSYMGAFLSLLILCACGNNTQSSESSSIAQTTTTTAISETTTAEITTTQESIAPPLSALNLLTGTNNLDTAALNKRPIAVMVNNNIQSLPQYGIAAADVIFEAPVEGGITRLMALYPDFTKVPNVCSVRSCRYYYPLIANGYDAIYIHWGSDQSIALDTLKRLGISHLDGGIDGAPIFGRDAERKKTFAYEHTGYLNGSELANGLANKGYRTDLKDGYNKPFFNFNAENAPQPPQGQACTKAVLNFSKAYYSTFTYDEASKAYLKQHNGSPHMDSSTNTQLSFTNVIVLKTNIAIRSTSRELLDIDLTKGTGKYISNGVSEDINWSKADDNSPFVLKKADGTPLSVNTGKSYIALIGNEKTVSIQ